MRRDRIVSRILLILSFVNASFAAPAVVRQGHLDVAGAASEKRWPSTSDDESGSSSASSTSLAGHAGELLHLPHSGGSWADTRARIRLDLFGVVRRPRVVRPLRINRVGALVARRFGPVAGVFYSREIAAGPSASARARVRVSQSQSQSPGRLAILIRHSRRRRCRTLMSWRRRRTPRPTSYSTTH